MLRLRLPLMFIAVSALWALAAHAEDRLLLKPVNVDLPFGDRVFEATRTGNRNAHGTSPILFALTRCAAPGRFARVLSKPARLRRRGGTRLARR
jgi:hypothetical protein